METAWWLQEDDEFQPDAAASGAESELLIETDPSETDPAQTGPGDNPEDEDGGQEGAD